MHALVVTAPDDLREHLRNFTKTQLVRTCAKFRPPVEAATITDAAKIAMKSLAQSYETHETHIKRLDRELARLVTAVAPELVARIGVGVESAGALLTATGDNPDRLASEPAFANMCAVAPIDASSGKQQRHRLNPFGNRQANAALHRIVITRLRYDEETKTYMARRITEGKTKKETIRCLKRYVARELYPIIRNSNKTPKNIYQNAA